MIDLLPLLKVSARLLDLHDSQRSYGASAQYNQETRPGNRDGIYVAIACGVLEFLHEYQRQSGDDYAGSASVCAAVRQRLDVAEVDIEYVLAVLSRPSELHHRLYLDEGDANGHVVSTKDSNLIEKTAHIDEYRLTKIGRDSLAVAADHLDITYIEGDAQKLLRALEARKLSQAVGFFDRMTDQLRTECHALRTLIERSGHTVLRERYVEALDRYREIIRGTDELARKAQLRVHELRLDAEKLADDAVPPGVLAEKLKDLLRGIVTYSNLLQEFAGIAASARSSGAAAPAFHQLARHWVRVPASNERMDYVIAQCGPIPVRTPAPIGTDFRNSVKARGTTTDETLTMDLGQFAAPEAPPIQLWTRAHGRRFLARVQDGPLSLDDAIREGFARVDGRDALSELLSVIRDPGAWDQDADFELRLSDGLSIVRHSVTPLMASQMSVQGLTQRVEADK